MSIFDKRVAFKPFEYPEILEYKKAINNSYWLVTEWNFLSDVQDFNIKLDEVGKNILKNALLAISQIEVSVKKFWTKLGDRFPKSEFEQVGITFGECFIDGTEILTPKGWVDLAKVKVDDEVIQYHQNDKTLSLTKVLHKTDSPYEGPMVRFFNFNSDVVVTPNHRMLCGDEIKLAEDLTKEESCKIPIFAKMTGRYDRLTCFDRLRIAIFAYGKRKLGKKNIYFIRLEKSQKGHKEEKIKNLVDNGDIPCRIKENNRQIIYWFEFNESCDNLSWVDLYDKSDEWCRDFIKEMSFWQREKATPQGRRFIESTSEEGINICQAVAAAGGYKTWSFSSIKRKRSYKEKFYILKYHRCKRPFYLNKEEIDYKGMVRCVTVESGAVVTRYKGYAFISGNSEVRHADAYSTLLQILGLNDDFNSLLENPVIQGRVDYLTKYLKGAADNSNENYTLTLTLFSIFIENVSLFSQFVIIKSFNKHLNILKDIDNVVSATSIEESLHALFGIKVITQIQKEFPDWFNDHFYQKLYRACKKAFEAECNIIDWIFEKGEMPFLSKEVVKEFVKNRFNESLTMIGGEKVFEVNPWLLEQVRWFDDEIHAEVNTDFFHKKPVTYSKRVQPITASDIF